MDVGCMDSIRRVEKQVSVERNHSASIGCFVGKQAPIPNRRAKSPEAAAFGESPVAVGFALRLGLPLDDLFSGLSEEFGHCQIQLRGQPLDLLVNRIGQLQFGSFHGTAYLMLRVLCKTSNIAGDNILARL